MKKILIIEDDLIVGNIYRNKLAVEGYKVELASDGEVGIQQLAEFKPDIVLLDLMLPKVPGLDVLRHIRTTEELKNIPVIVFSNTYLSSMVQAAWKGGATKCITKASCTPRQLLDVLRGVSSEGNNNAASCALATGSPNCPSHPPKSPAAVNLRELESLGQADLKRAFSNSLPGQISALRPLLLKALKEETQPARARLMGQMYLQMRTITGEAGIVGFLRVAQMASATEALLKDLQDKPQNINQSTLRTIASALDVLGTLLTPEQAEEEEVPRFGSILVVDDDLVSRRAVGFALEKARLCCVSTSNPQTALELLQENKFDLIFLDIDMPKMSGLELCAKLRSIPSHRSTPVVFVTALNDFESRTNSTVSGGTDFIGKPFLFMELAVKALCYVTRSRTSKPTSAKLRSTPVQAEVLT